MEENHYICDVIGTHPKTGDKMDSRMYSRITKDNVSELFNPPMDMPQDEVNFYETKAVAYMTDRGKWLIGFMSETEFAHHRHALAALVLHDFKRMTESRPVSEGYEKSIHTMTLALYSGNGKKSRPLLERSVGFKLRYDLDEGLINKIYQQSWMTNRFKPEIDMQIDATIELISRIDPILLSSQYKELNIVDQDDLILEKRVE